jgi:hypothetical protein
MTNRNLFEWIERYLKSDRSDSLDANDLTFQSIRSNDGYIAGDELETGQSLTIAEDEYMVTGGSFEINGDADIQGDLVTVSNQTSHSDLEEITPTDHLEVVKEWQVTLSSGSQPAFDGTLSRAVDEETSAFDVTVAPTNGLNETYGFNYDAGKHWNNGEWDVPMTINWDDDPGTDLTVSVRVHRRT